MDSPPDSFESTQPVRPGDVIPLVVERLGDNGDGMCRVQNYVVWVSGVLPGEHVDVEIVAAGRKNGRGIVREIKQTSAARVEPRCAHYGECGGCQLQHLDYQAQLAFKTETVASHLRHALGREEVPVRACIGPDDPWGHRNRIALQVTERHGQLAGGLYRRRSRELIEITECPVSHPDGLGVALHAVEAARGIGVEAWDPRTDAGTLRTALVRTNSQHRSELTLVVRHKDDAEIAGILAADIAAHSIHLNLNNASRERMLGRYGEHLAGEEFFTEVVAGRTLRLSAAAWLRTSTFGLERTAALVRELLEPIPGARVLDLYSGVGVFALAIADLAAEVIGIEEHPRAILDAIASAKASGIENVQFRKGKVEPHLRDMKGEKVFATIMDPPPEGCGRFVINILAKEVRPERLIYVSQSPTSFAEDTAVFEDRGFRLTAVHPIDSAPHTASVELVALFESSVQSGKRRSSISQARRLLKRVRDEEKKG